jgi:putative MATE family efflux protein
LIAQAAGRKDQPHAEVVFNQSFVMSIVIAFGLGIVGFILRPAYCDWLSADIATADLAKAYLLWFLPGLLLQFPLVALGSALRATGIIKPAVGFQVLSVFLNIVLAPLLIFGIGPWPKLGVTGAALATFISILIADVLMIFYFEKKYHYVRFRFPLFRPQTKIWKRMLGIGVPAGTEFLLLFVYIVLVYVIIRGFGPEAQAGFGIGARVMQALFLPVVALSFAVAPVVGQNFGGRRADSRPAFCLFSDRHCIIDDGGAHADRISRTGDADSNFLTGPASDCLRQRIPADCLIKFYIGRNCFHYIQRLSGNRKHAATAV